MWLGQVPWAGRHWALSVLTVLALSSRYHQQQGRRHKKVTDWARQMVMQLRRWLSQRPLVLVGDPPQADWICSTAASRSVNPAPSLPDCAWTPLCTRQRRLASRVRTEGQP